ncbi:hypothetical protein IW262DRAFT_1281738, partial [Armillaria fumosa]
VWHCISLFSLLPPTSRRALTIDYSTEWMKASLMKPGLPFNMLLNKDSKRKIQSIMAWKKDDRLFSTFNLVCSTFNT